MIRSNRLTALRRLFANRAKAKLRRWLLIVAIRGCLWWAGLMGTILLGKTIREVMNDA